MPKFSTLIGTLDVLPLTVDEVYNSIKNLSFAKFNLKVISSRQKEGNCLIKEPETAIKYAFSTKNCSLDKIYSLRKSLWNTLRRKNPHEEFKPKWNIPTKLMYKNFIKSVKLEYPQISDLLDEIYYIYESNKSYRHYILDNVNPEEALFKAFDPQNIFTNLNDNEKTKKTA